MHCINELLFIDDGASTIWGNIINVSKFYGCQNETPLAVWHYRSIKKASIFTATKMSDRLVNSITSWICICFCEVACLALLCIYSRSAGRDIVSSFGCVEKWETLLAEKPFGIPFGRLWECCGARQENRGGPTFSIAHKLWFGSISNGSRCHCCKAVRLQWLSSWET